LARTLGARSWELRTATTIAGRRLEQHRYTEAVEVLGPAIAGLPETQSTPDLNDARQLMKDLLERGPTDLQRIAERSLS
jgi:predicted ATPase